MRKFGPFYRVKDTHGWTKAILLCLDHSNIFWVRESTYFKKGGYVWSETFKSTGCLLICMVIVCWNKRHCRELCLFLRIFETVLTETCKPRQCICKWMIWRVLSRYYLKLISLTDLLCSLGSEGLKSIGLCLPRKRKFSNTVQFSPGILSIHLLTQFAFLKQDWKKKLNYKRRL